MRPRGPAERRAKGTMVAIFFAAIIAGLIYILLTYDYEDGKLTPRNSLLKSDLTLPVENVTATDHYHLKTTVI